MFRVVVRFEVSLEFSHSISTPTNCTYIKFFTLKKFKIAPTCFDPKIVLQGATLFLAKVTFLKTLID